MSESRDVARAHAHAAPARRESLVEWLRLVRRTAHVARRFPELVLGRALEEPEGASSRTAAEHLLAARPSRRVLVDPRRSEEASPRSVRIDVGDSVPVRLRWDRLGLRAATLHRDASLRVWNLVVGAEHFRIEAGDLPISSLAVTPTAIELVRGGRVLERWPMEGTGGASREVMTGDEVRLWDATAGKPLLLVRENRCWTSRDRDSGAARWTVEIESGELEAVAEDPPRLVVRDGAHLRVWSPTHGWRTLEPPGDAVDNELSRRWLVARDGRWALHARAYMISGPVMFEVAQVTDLRLFDLETCREVAQKLDQGPEQPTAIQASETAGLVAIASGGLRLAELATLETVGSIAAEPIEGERLAFSRDGRSLLTANDASVELWDLDLLRRPRDSSGWRPVRLETVSDCQVSQTGDRILLVGVAQFEMSYQLLDENGRELAYHGTPFDLGWARLAPDGRAVAIARRDSVALWRVGPPARYSRPEGFHQSWSRELGLALDQRDAPRMEFTPDGEHLVVAGATGKIAMLRTEDGQPAWSRDLKRGELNGLDLDPAGRRLVVRAMGVEGSRLLRLADGEIVRTLSGSRFAFGPDGSILAVVGEAGEIELVDADAGSTIAALPAAEERVTELLFVAGGDLLLATSDSGRLTLRQSRTGLVVARVRDEERAVASAEESTTRPLVSFVAGGLLRVRSLPGLELVAQYWFDDASILRATWRQRDDEVLTVLANQDLRKLRLVHGGG